MIYHIGDKINKLSYIIKREFLKLPAIEKLDRISATNGFILMYIYDSKKDVFQKDIENHFGMTRSTASRVISLMEQKNLLIRESVEKDQRLKKLSLTEESRLLCVEVSNQIIEFDNKLTTNLDKERFVKDLDLICSNLNGGTSK